MECPRQEERRINRRSISTIPISRYHVANLSLETPTILNRHHIRIISKHTINTNAPALQTPKGTQTLEDMPPQNSKRLQVPFGNDANFANYPGDADIKIQPKSPGIPLRHAVFLQLLACLARHPSAFTSLCGTDTAGRGALEPPLEAGARTKLFDREFQCRESHT